MTVATAPRINPYATRPSRISADYQLDDTPFDSRQHLLRILVYNQASPAEDVTSYAKYLGDLLDAHLGYIKTNDRTNGSFNKLLKRAARDRDLVICGAPCQSILTKLFSGRIDCKAADCIPISTLIARCPRRPLKEILLVTRGQAMDNVAVDWAIRLAQASEATIRVLAIVPPMPAMCHQALRSRSQMGAWLGADTTLGRQVERLKRQLMNWEVEKRLRFREGEPDWQIQQEVKEENYDLIVIAADPSDWWTRRLLGELVKPLLRWIDRPVLVAKS